MKCSGNFRIRIFSDHPGIFRADTPDQDEPKIRVTMPVGDLLLEYTPAINNDLVCEKKYMDILVSKSKTKCLRITNRSTFINSYGSFCLECGQKVELSLKKVKKIVRIYEA